ncbi:hypothetical protein PMI01_04651 [Caulobacter sp. AP07]|uniref:DUF6088 family protein n=1 Tax=Caulobacter sp. AP07 TaxID=1144304 RepID=UPI00027225B7|nr:DUF6088 family protein [Caulobacter sp. AP07]EJL24470.1 hypothetical protein PMI01_04651 [Caulobacter sp. AP07]
MQRLTQAILEHAPLQPEGASVSAKALLHLGSRAAVDQALSRLARRGQLIRAGRGLYVRPVESRFGQRPPSVEHVVRSLAASTDEVIASHGAAAANALGLTTQVPIREVYLTSGPSRRLKLGVKSVDLRHAPKWQLTLADRPAGEVIRALAWLGEAHAPAALRSLEHRLSSDTLAEIVGARPRLPTWLAQQVSRLAVNG